MHYLPVPDWLAAAAALLAAAALAAWASTFMWTDYRMNHRKPYLSETANVAIGATLYIAAMALAWLPFELMAP